MTETRKNEELIAWLRENHFARVNGLPTYRAGETEIDYLIRPRRDQVGHTDYNNGLTVVVDFLGGVWIACGTFGDLSSNFDLEHGAGVPCTNGEAVDLHHFMARLQNPFDNFDGMYSADVEFLEDAKA